MSGSTVFHFKLESVIFSNTTNSAADVVVELSDTSTYWLECWSEQHSGFVSFLFSTLYSGHKRHGRMKMYNNPNTKTPYGIFLDQLTLTLAKVYWTQFIQLHHVTYSLRRTITWHTKDAFYSRITTKLCFYG